MYAIIILYIFALISLSAAVEFAFREPVLSANEGFIIRELCVIKIGTTTKDVTFNITLEGTAVGRSLADEDLRVKMLNC